MLTYLYISDIVYIDLDISFFGESKVDTILPPVSPDSPYLCTGMVAELAEYSLRKSDRAVDVVKNNKNGVTHKTEKSVARSHIRP